MQLQPFPFDTLTQDERRQIEGDIRRFYWHIRSARDSPIGDAKRRRYYRKVALQKKRLLMAGVSKREVLDLLRCCRLQCDRFKGCAYCAHYR